MNQQVLPTFEVAVERTTSTSVRDRSISLAASRRRASAEMRSRVEGSPVEICKDQYERNFGGYRPNAFQIPETPLVSPQDSSLQRLSAPLTSDGN
jgi:hypothetical protein